MLRAWRHCSSPETCTRSALALLPHTLKCSLDKTMNTPELQHTRELVLSCCGLHTSPSAGPCLTALPAASSSSGLTKAVEVSCGLGDAGELCTHCRPQVCPQQRLCSLLHPRTRNATTAQHIITAPCFVPGPAWTFLLYPLGHEHPRLQAEERSPRNVNLLPRIIIKSRCCPQPDQHN